VSKRLADVRGTKVKFAPVKQSAALPGTSVPSLPNLGNAPAFTGTEDWFNTPGDRPLTLAGLRGRVVLIDFWTYTCINCIRTLPYLEAWDAKYRREGLVIVGIESPEFPFEADAGNVRSAIRQFGIRYPVVQDNNLTTWNAWGNQYWPADYLIDATGQVRYATFGEGDYARTESVIRVLLAEAGAKGLGAGAHPRGIVVPSLETSPETYLGTARATGWVGGAPFAGTHTYPHPSYPLTLDDFSYTGTWTIGPQQAVAGRGAAIDARIQAKNVYVIFSPPRHGAGTVTVSVDGRRTRTIAVTGQRLYTVASFATDGEHAIHLAVSPGTSGYSFTFG